VPRSGLNRSFASTAGVLLALNLLLSCQSKLDSTGTKASPLPASTPSQTVDLIASVKDVLVSRLEKGLPAVRFEDWVRENAGPDWVLSWTFTQGGKDAAAHVLDSGSVDVRGDTKDGQYFRLSIGTTTTPDKVLLFWLSGAANLQHKWVRVDHLGQLPRLLHHVGQSSRDSVPQK
jgi:hypothetical protein